MLGRLKQMLIKELIQVVRDKRTRFILIGPPIIQMLVFGYAATFEIRQRAHRCSSTWITARRAANWFRASLRALLRCAAVN